MSTPTAIQHHHLLSVSDYYRMAEANILSEDEHVELINGELFDKAPIGSFHADYIDRLARLFFKQADDSVRVRIQNPIHLSDFTEPEPDIALVKDNNYCQQHPTAQDVLLLVEVADTSLNYDLNIKLPLYAKHQIPEVWLCDVKEKRLDIYQQPDNDHYRLHLRPKAEEKIQPLLVALISVDWQGLFSYP
jgi:Uma2 family endonuclease